MSSTLLKESFQKKKSLCTKCHEFEQFAKGMCRRCYGAQWRLLKGYSPRVKHDGERDEEQRVREQVEREIRTLEALYRVAVGFEAHLRIRLQLRAARVELEALKEKVNGV